MNTHNNTPSQNSIGRALGLSSAMMVKMKKQGCPMDSVEAVLKWRRANIKPTMHAMLKPIPTRPATLPQPSGALLHALALLDIAAVVLEAGQSLDALVPTLRTALRAVPESERHSDPDMLIQVEVWELLIRDVRALADGDDDPDAHCAYLTDEEADEMAIFWWQVAAGELRCADWRDSPTGFY